MKYYQPIKFRHKLGIIATDAPESAVQGISRRVWEENYTEEEEEIMAGIVYDYDIDKVVAILNMQGWNAERINVIDINV